MASYTQVEVQRKPLSTKDLVSLFLSAAAEIRKSIVLFIDALDQSALSTRDELLKFLIRLTHSTRFKVYICVSSRDTLEIAKLMDKLSACMISVARPSQAMLQRYVKTGVHRLFVKLRPGHSEEDPFKQHLIKELLDRSDGRYEIPI
jgi:hypothetical protein